MLGDQAAGSLGLIYVHFPRSSLRNHDLWYITADVKYFALF